MHEFHMRLDPHGVGAHQNSSSAVLSPITAPTVLHFPVILLRLRTIAPSIDIYGVIDRPPTLLQRVSVEQILLFKDSPLVIQK